MPALAPDGLMGYANKQVSVLRNSGQIQATSCNSQEGACTHTYSVARMPLGSGKGEMKVSGIFLRGWMVRGRVIGDLKELLLFVGQPPVLPLWVLIPAEVDHFPYLPPFPPGESRSSQRSMHKIGFFNEISSISKNWLLAEDQRWHSKHLKSQIKNFMKI